MEMAGLPIKENTATDVIAAIAKNNCLVLGNAKKDIDMLSKDEIVVEHWKNINF